MGELTRRGFVKTMSVAGVSMAIFGLSGCAPKETGKQGTLFNEGVYRASSVGKFGPIELELTFSKDAITNVEIVKHEESAFISDTALETIPKAIVEHQSLDIDVITGASLTSMAIINAASDCVKQAGAKPSDLEGNYEKPAASTETQAIDAEVVIIGAGAAGMAAAVTAARLGAKKVAVFEKSCTIGGNSLVSAGFIKHTNAPEELREEMTESYNKRLLSDLEQAPAVMPNDHYEELSKAYEQWKASGSTKVFDCTYLSALQSTINGEGQYPVKYEAAQTIETLLNWMLSEGFEFSPLSGMVGTPWPRYTHPAEDVLGHGYYLFYNRLIEREQYPIEIHLNTPATKLIVENGRVCGAEAVDSTGCVYQARANKGVIIATGGFSGNADLLRKHNTKWPFKDGVAIPTTNCYGHTGDGIELGTSVGAAVAHMDLLMSFPFADCKNSSDETTVGDDVDCLIVNKEGKRFMSENLPRDVMTKNIMEQPDEMMFILSDADTSHVENGMNRYGHSIQSLADQGQLHTADTLEELAQAMGCDPAVLTATVKRYNEIVKNQHDPDFNRTLFTSSSAIENPPFFASPRTWAMHITGGGIVVDRDNGYCVLNEAGEKIPGLFAAGETVDGSFGNGSQGEGFKVATALFA